MQITLDTSNPEDLKVMRELIVFLGSDVPAAAPAPAAADEQSIGQKTAATVKKAIAKAKEVDAAAEPSADDASLEAAVELATEMVSSGQANRIKLALADQGSTRVGLLDPDKIGAFIEEATRFKDMSDVDFAAEESSRG
jgi:pyruvate/2-oxoglutarate dehydrogenase complex dihydrolipoamide acyltransferase (E2) component